MGIEQTSGKRPLGSTPPPTWGELTSDGQIATVVRFIVEERIVTVVASEIRRWEHPMGEPERLMLQAGREVFVVEGRDLAVIRSALDLGRVCEIRPNYQRLGVRPGPRVARITIESL